MKWLTELATYKFVKRDEEERFGNVFHDQRSNHTDNRKCHPPFT